MSFPRSYSSRHASPVNPRYSPYPPSRSNDLGQGWPAHQPSFPLSRSSSASSLSQDPISFGQDPELELPSFQDAFVGLSQGTQSPMPDALDNLDNDWQLNNRQSPAFGSRPRGRALSRSVPAADVERLAGRRGVCGNQLQQFNQLSEAHKSLEIFALLLQQQNEAADTRKILGDVLNTVSEASASISRDFKPSKPAIRHMRRMTRHYLAQPLRSYYSVDSATKNYYLQRPSENHPLGVDAYPGNISVKNVIHRLLKDFAAQARSNLRKLIWRCVRDRTQLAIWAKFMMEHYWFSSSGHALDAPKMLQARLALMRQIAFPLVALPTKQGQSTGFWRLLNRELAQLYAAHGEVTTAGPWERWADEIIAKDKAMYTEAPQGEMQAPNDDEDLSLDN